LPYRVCSGEVVSAASPQKLTKKIAEKARVDWVRNGLRKGFVTHAMALHKNATLVAEWSGHSVAELQTDYKGIVFEKDGEKWFNIKDNND
jgi:hypothetical protein